MSQSAEHDREGVAWQRGIWERYPEIYQREIDKRFAPVVQQVIRRAALSPGQHVLDLGTGTGSVALQAAPLVAPTGVVLAVDLSPAMLAAAQQRAGAMGVGNVRFREGRAEAIPAADGAVHVVLASLSLMYAIDQAAAAREIARVLRPDGGFVAAVWAGPEQCDIVLFQHTAGRFAPQPPVSGVGPGALADPTPFLQQLAEAGIIAHVETETLGFDYENFDLAWDVLARTTAADLAPDRPLTGDTERLGAAEPRPRAVKRQEANRLTIHHSNIVRPRILRKKGRELPQHINDIHLCFMT